jgi:molybdopterin molybdotransferase
MDGYAVCSSDTKAASTQTPCHLMVIEEIPAGTMPKKIITQGLASRIMTGAPIPKGADAVVKIEEITVNHDETILITGPVMTGEFIRPRGEVVREGDLLLLPGIAIRPYEIALMATIGVQRVSVSKRPTVAILSTGDELVDIHENREPHQIYNSNGYGLAAAVTEAGGVPILLGIAKDTRSDLIEKLKHAADADFILLSGGVSVGDYDIVKSVFSDAGSQMKFWKVAMKPGKPLAFGLLSGKPAFGLPGNPVSAMVTFDQFVRPALLSSQGSDCLFRPIVHAKLTTPIEKEPGRCHFVRGRLSVQEGEYQVVPTGDQDSSNMVSLVKANALIVIAAESRDVVAGTIVSVQVIS